MFGVVFSCLHSNAHSDVLCWTVILSEAGEGVVEITLTDPVGHLVANQVVTAEPGVLEVVYTPKVAGLHRAAVIFNSEVVPGMHRLVDSTSK